MTNSKLDDILDANDIYSLRQHLLETPKILTPILRIKIWPLVIPQPSIISHQPILTNLNYSSHRDYQQVLKDVNRSFINYDDNSIPKSRLLKVIMSSLIMIPDLYYYQGYHDVASVMVTVFPNDDDAIRSLCAISVCYLRDHTLKDINESLIHLHLIPEIINIIDPKFHKYINTPNPIYSLSAILSIFSHDLNKFDSLIQIWDFIFLHNDPKLVIYIYASMVLYFKDDILLQLQEIGSGNDMIQFTLSKLIQNNLNNSIDIHMEIKSILSLSLRLRDSINLNKLKSFKRLNKYSVLKMTTSSLTILKLQSIKLNNKKSLDYYKISSKLVKLSTFVLILAMIFKSMKN